MNDYRHDIDLIKGIAIIGVIFYHIGLLPYGFLGVDAFLTITGFLIIPNIIKNFSDKQFNYFSWLKRRLFRIWPITLAACIIALIVGYFVMIPDSYENLSESVVASNFFANNILAAITTKNYWDTTNEFKPLMQMWYLGVLGQFYVLFPIILLLIGLIFKRFKKKISFWIITVLILGIGSIVWYLIPGLPYTLKFYFVQFRLWEFLTGGLIGIMVRRTQFRIKLSKNLSVVLILLFCCVLCLGVQGIDKLNSITIVGDTASQSNPVFKMLFTILTVLLTSLILLTNVKMGGVFCKLSEKCL